MQAAPTTPYVYQPGPARDDGRIFGVGGPGTEEYRDMRFTQKAAAELVVKLRRKQAAKRFAAMLGVKRT